MYPRKLELAMLCLIACLVFSVGGKPPSNATHAFHIKLSKEQLKDSAVRLHVFTSAGRNRTFTVDYQTKASDQLATICDRRQKKLTKFIVHGFSETWNMTNRWDWVKKMIDEMLKTAEAEKLCIVVLDWKVGWLLCSHFEILLVSKDFWLLRSWRTEAVPCSRTTGGLSATCR